MKQITAIVNKSDSAAVESALVDKGFYITKIASSGGFLRDGSCTYLSAVEDSQVDEVVEIISQNSQRRKQMVASAAGYEYTQQLLSPSTVEITVGGATIIISNIEKFLKV